MDVHLHHKINVNDQDVILKQKVKSMPQHKKKYWYTSFSSIKGGGGGGDMPSIQKNFIA